MPFVKPSSAVKHAARRHIYMMNSRHSNTVISGQQVRGRQVLAWQQAAAYKT